MINRDILLRCLAFIAAGVLLIVAQKLPNRSKAEPLRVAVGLWPGVESMILARERGLLPKNRFQLVEATWASAIYRAFDSGVVDVAVLTLDAVQRLLESGEALRVVYVMDVSQGADGLLAQQGIEGVAGLKGERIGVDVRGSGMYLLSALFSKAGLATDEVEIVPLMQPEMENAFLQEDVSAVVVSEPWMTVMKSMGGHVLADSSSVSPSVHRVLVVREDAFVERREDIVELLRVHLEMISLLTADDAAEDVKVIFRREGLSREQFLSALGRVRLLDFGENRMLLGSGGMGISKIASQMSIRPDREGDGRGIPPSDEWTDETIMLEVRR